MFPFGCLILLYSPIYHLEMDGLKNRLVHDIVVIATTSHLESLDLAILRPGRIGLHFRVSLPDESVNLGCLENFECVLGSCPVFPGSIPKNAITAFRS